ncbi:MAG: hypothetical protein ACRD3Q_21525 [Terriglobales bacterium]
MPKPLRTLGIGAVTVGLCVALIAVAGYVLVRFTDVRVPFISDTCRAYGNDHVVRLKPTQLTYAATIAAVGTTHGMGDQGIAVALATALQESKLHNLSHGDRDSVGLFQQRPSQGWGTAEQLQDPHYASTEFFIGLRRVKGWAAMSIGDAAQAVQRSAHPTAYGKWAADATALTRAFTGQEIRAVTCKLRESAKLSGGKAADGIRREYARDYDNPNLRTSVNGEGPELTLKVPVNRTSGEDRASGSVTGWRAAHWFVAKSRDYGVTRVSYAGARWSASSGKWEKRNSAEAAELIIQLKG